MQDSDLHPRLLLVEGSEDKYFVLRLSERNNLLDRFWILNKGGKDQLIQSIGAEANVEGRTTLGIVLDADDDVTARWQEVTKELDELRQEEHFDLPELPDQPRPNGIVVEGTIRIGVWLMPDNRSSGEIEDLVAKMIPCCDKMWPLAEQFIDDIPEELRVFRLEKASKSKVYAWLATRKEPRAMGLAVEAGDLDISVPNSTAFVNWLRRLFT